MAPNPGLARHLNISPMEIYDIAVIGGGFSGAARDAAGRRVKVPLAAQGPQLLSIFGGKRIAHHKLNEHEWQGSGQDALGRCTKCALNISEAQHQRAASRVAAGR